MQKFEKQLGKAKIAENNPALKFTNKIQKILCQLRKENKFRGREYFQIYPSDLVPPRLYGTMKAHKPEKNYLIKIPHHLYTKQKTGKSKQLKSKYLTML